MNDSIDHEPRDLSILRDPPDLSILRDPPDLSILRDPPDLSILRDPPDLSILRDPPDLSILRDPPDLLDLPDLPDLPDPVAMTSVSCGLRLRIFGARAESAPQSEIRDEAGYGSPSSVCRRSQSRTTDAPAGGLMKVPWAASQPISQRRVCAFSFSTPSATTVSPRLCARSIVERTITSSSPLARPATNDRSILSSSTGSRRR